MNIVLKIVYWIGIVFLSILILGAVTTGIQGIANTDSYETPYAVGLLIGTGLIVFFCGWAIRGLYRKQKANLL